MFEIIPQSISGGYASYVAKVGDSCAGEVVASFGGEGAAYIDRIKVPDIPEYRGKGIGTALMGAIEEWAAQEGATHAFLVFSVDNPADGPGLIDFLDHLGYECGSFHAIKALE